MGKIISTHDLELLKKVQYPRIIGYLNNLSGYFDTSKHKTVHKLLLTVNPEGLKYEHLKNANINQSFGLVEEQFIIRMTREQMTELYNKIGKTLKIKTQVKK